jgi:CBS-domain-containing membrane protein
MRVADLMETNLRTVSTEWTIGEVVQQLADRGVSGLPVIDPAGRFVGVVSSSDVLEAEAAAGPGREREALFENTTAKDIMTPRPLTIGPEEDVREAAQQMLYAEVRRIFVEAEGQLVGVISQGDIVRAVAQGAIPAGA